MFLNGQIIPDPQNEMEHVLVVHADYPSGMHTITRGGVSKTTTVLASRCKQVSLPTLPLMRRLAYSIGQQEKTVQGLTESYDALQMEQVRKLQEIRRWMVSLFEDDKLDRDDLDEMLEKFGMEPYSVRWVGRATIEVTLTVDDARDLDEAEQMAYDWAERALEDDGGDGNISSPGVAAMTYKLEVAKD